MRHRRSTAILGSILLAAALLAGCASSPPDTTPFSYTGTWSGSIDDSIGGRGSTTMHITQSGSDLAGTWQAMFGGGHGIGGTLTGLIVGQEVEIELLPAAAGSCPHAGVGQRSGNTLSGTYEAYNCSVTVTGTFDVTKQ